MRQDVTHVLFVTIETPDLHKYLLDAVEMKITSNDERVYHIYSTYNDEKTAHIITQLMDKFREEHGIQIASFMETQNTKEMWAV